MKLKEIRGKQLWHLPIGLDPAHGKDVSATVVEHELVRLLPAFASQLAKQANSIQLQVSWHRLANCL